MALSSAFSLLFLLLCCPLLCNAFPFFPLNETSNRRPHGGAHNYADALTKSILFFEGQRSGKLPSSQRISWRGDSGLSDGAEMHVDLVGGYYDAGDNVKFGFPMAFTTTMLSWSVLEFGGVMKHELSNAKEAVKWATDYLLKATSLPDTIFVQVGDAAKDHACWERPEDMDTPRNVFKIDKNSPGTEVAAETAAALAAASLVFRKSDPIYSKLLVRRAIRVFEFADKHRGSYSDALRQYVCPYYCDYSGYQDELLWGAAWLHKATRNPAYLSYIQTNGHILGADESDNSFCWDNKHAGARILLSKAFLIQSIQPLHEYKIHSDSYICSVLPKSPVSNAQFTKGGLLFKMNDANLQYVTSTSFLLVTYAKYLSSSQQVAQCGGSIFTPKMIRAFAKKQVDYILGDNPMQMSYMVGYGSKYPQRIHHRGSSLPSMTVHPSKLQCSFGFGLLNSESPNPNVLMGAVVGGPDQNDRFPDQRSDYEHSEPSTYINAPFVGTLAYLAHSFGQI